MAGITDLNTIWRNIREIDLQGFRDEALREVHIAIVGATGSGRHTLADNLRRDPSRPDMQTQTPVLILDLEEAKQPFKADLILIMVDAREQEFPAEMALAGRWNNQGKKIIVFYNQFDSAITGVDRIIWPASRVITGSAIDGNFLQQKFVSLVMEILPNQLLGLGRQFPLFRIPIAHHLINETCFANATYALGTGLAEVVAVLNLPLTVADMVVLTKSQAFLVYKLGLVFGFSLQWRDYLTEFGSVVGGGFLWRQLARSLVGLIPILGIIPKIAVSYSGTFVVGHTILQWYLTGRHLSAQQMKALTVHAFQRGQETARRITIKMHRPRLEGGRKKGKKEKQAVLGGNEELVALAPGGVSGIEVPAIAAKSQKKRFLWSKKDKSGKTDVKAEKTAGKLRKKSTRKGKEVVQEQVKLCQQCHRANALDANFCQYCATPFDITVETQ